VELHECGEQLVRVGGAVGPVLAAGQQVLAYPDEELREQGLLAREVPVERRSADADRGTQVGDADAVAMGRSLTVG
jgi:hypothetical protein